MKEFYRLWYRRAIMLLILTSVCGIPFACAKGDSAICQQSIVGEEPFRAQSLRYNKSWDGIVYGDKIVYLSIKQHFWIEDRTELICIDTNTQQMRRLGRIVGRYGLIASVEDGLYLERTRYAAPFRHIVSKEYQIFSFPEFKKEKTLGSIIMEEPNEITGIYAMNREVYALKKEHGSIGLYIYDGDNYSDSPVISPVQEVKAYDSFLLLRYYDKQGGLENHTQIFTGRELYDLPTDFDWFGVKGGVVRGGILYHRVEDALCAYNLKTGKSEEIYAYNFERSGGFLSEYFYMEDYLVYLIDKDPHSLVEVNLIDKSVVEYKLDIDIKSAEHFVVANGYVYIFDIKKDNVYIRAVE